MPLLFNGQPFSLDEAKLILGDKYPKQLKGKEQFPVTFVLSNAKPLLRFTERGEKIIQNGGTKPIQTTCIARKNSSSDGELTYYESKGKVQGKGGLEDNYEPKFVYFEKHELSFDAKKNEALFCYLMLSSLNESNADTFGKKPLFRLLDTSSPLRKNLEMSETRLEAYDAVREAFEKNKPKFKALYQNFGYTDYASLKEIGELSLAKAKMFEHCEQEPKRVLELLSSASLDVGAIISMALEYGVIKQEANAFYWVANKKKIWAYPQGRDDDAFDLFVNYLRLEDKSGTFDQIRKDTTIEASRQS